MEIYTISGYAPNYEDGSVHVVSEVYATREQAEQSFAELMALSRTFASDAEEMRGVITGHGTWSEASRVVHGSQHYLKKYVCEVSVDLSTEEGLAMFRKCSAAGLIKDGTAMSVLNGITIDSMYTAFSFNITSIELKCREVK